MRKLLKPKFFILLFWVVVVFGSIAALPNLQTFVTKQITQTAATTAVTKQQARWGHGLADTQSLTLVYNNPGGKLTSYQQYQIHNALANISAKADYYGIKQLRTSQTMTNDHQLLTSNDGSTELALAAVKTSPANLAIVADQLNSAMAVSGLNTAVTSPVLVSSQHQTHQLREAVSVLLIGSAVMLLILGFIFRSLLVPLINLLIQTMTIITTISLNTLIIDRWHPTFVISSLVLTGVLSLIMTSFLTWSYMHDYLAEAIVKDTDDATAAATLKIQAKRFGPGLLLMVVLGSALSFTAWSGLASAWSLVLTLVITCAAALSLNYALSALLGDSIYWPGTRAWAPRPKNIWGQLTRLSHWQPLLGLAIVAVLLLPGLLNAHAQYADDNLRPTRQNELTVAELGQQMITAHFGNGAADPIVLTVQSPKVLTEQAQLQTLDDLTQKIKAVPNVAQVTSVTQPTGHKLTPFYVKHQLALINADLLGKQATVTTLQKQLTTSQQELQAAATGKHAKTIDRLTTRLNKVAAANDDLLTAIYDLNDTLSQPQTVKKHFGAVNRQFNHLDDLTDHLTNLLNSAADTQTTIIDQVDHVNHNVRAATKKLKKTTQSLQSLMASLKVTQTYLTGLSQSQIGDRFYLPANGHLNAQFQNSIFTNVSSDSHLTQLTVTLKSAPTSSTSYQTVARLQQIADTAFLATPLAKASVTSSGITSEQAHHHQMIRQHAVKWVGLILAIVALGLWIGLGSLTLSLLLTLSLSLVTIASWGWTQLLTNHWFHVGPLSSAVLIWSLGLLIFHWLVITTITMNRQHWLRQFNAEKLRRHFYLGGQLIWPVTTFESVYLIAYLLMSDINLRAFGIMGLIGIGLSNLLVPLAIPGIITWTVHPPKLKWFRQKKHAASASNN